MRWPRRRLGCGNARKSLWPSRSCCYCSCSVEKQGTRTSICTRVSPRSPKPRICHLLWSRQRSGCSYSETLSYEMRKRLILFDLRMNKWETKFETLPLSLLTRSVPSTTRIRESEDVTSTSDELPGTNYMVRKRETFFKNHHETKSFAPEQVNFGFTWKPVIFFWWAFFFLFCKFIWLFCCNLLSDALYMRQLPLYDPTNAPFRV